MLLAFLGLIPGALSLFAKYTEKKFDAQVAIYQAKTGATRDVAVAAIKAAVDTEHEGTAKLAIFASNKMMTLILLLFALPIAVWFNKIVMWDIVFSPIFTGHTGMTDPIKGEALKITEAVIYCMFGSGTLVTISSMWARKL